MINIECSVCKKSFFGYKSSKKKFCSRKCFHKFRTGPNHPRWVGVGNPFFIKLHNRYKISVNGKKMPYARFLMEKYLGRKLGVDEIVHHISGDSTDDKLQNLVVISRANHTAHHSFKDANKKIKCFNCGIAFNRSKSQILKNSFCSKKCYNQNLKKNWENIFKRSRKKIECTCDYCKKAIFLNPCRFKSSKLHFCSTTCQHTVLKPPIKKPKPKQVAPNKCFRTN